MHFPNSGNLRINFYRNNTLKMISPSGLTDLHMTWLCKVDSETWWVASHDHFPCTVHSRAPRTRSCKQILLFTYSVNFTSRQLNTYIKYKTLKIKKNKTKTVAKIDHELLSSTACQWKWHVPPKKSTDSVLVRDADALYRCVYYHNT